MKYIGKHNAFDELLIGPVLFTFPDAASFYQLTLPVDDGSSGQVLATDGNGVLSWVANGVAVPNALTIGTGVDLASGNTSWDGSAAETLNLDLMEVIATDGANRLLTSDGDGTLTAEANATFNGSILNVTGVVDISPSATAAASALTIDNDDIDQIALEIVADNTIENIIEIAAHSLSSNNIMLMDMNTTWTGACSTAGLYHDLDKFGVKSNTTISSYVGLKSDIHDWATNHAGSTITYTGIENNLTNANSTGTLTHFGLKQTLTGGTLANMTGIWQKVDDGATDLKFVSSADTGDYFSISTTTHGATTFKTLDDNATAADLIFSPDGDAIFNILDADPASLFKIATVGGTNHFLEISGEDGNYSRFKMYEQGGSSTDDYFKIEVGEHGATTISTEDNAGTAANLNFDADGNIDLDARQITFDSLLSQFYFVTGAYEHVYIGANSIHVKGSVAKCGDFNLYEDASNGTNKIRFKPPDSISSDKTITLPDATGTVALTSAIPTVPTDTVTTGAHIHTQTKVTIDATACNGLSSSPVTLVAAQGADTIIVPVSVTVLLDRNSADSSGADLIVGYNGTTNYQYAIRYMRRFMLGITTDMQFNMVPYFNGHGANSLTGGTNVPLTMSTSAPITAGSLTSMVVYTSYYVIDK
tara:strand:- start:850 stop:2790 length:1941 start_codon:yes stop_codon:yes gene_type:complete